MKKQNGGYALALVLVVLAVLSLLASVILAASLRNVRFQQTAAQRMSDKYAVEGQVERIASQLEAMKGAGVIDLNDSPETGLQILVVDNTSIVIRARSGQIQADCVLFLEGLTNGSGAVVPVTITDADSNGVCDGIYQIAGLAKVRYAHYEIYTVEEVAADADVPEVYTGTVPAEESMEQ